MNSLTEAPACQAGQKQIIHTIPNLPRIDFSDSERVVEALKAKHAHLPEVTNEATRKLVTAGITEFKSARSAIEKKRKELKAESLEWQRALDGEAKRVTALFEEAEAVLIAKRQPYDDAVEAKKRAEEEARLAAARAEQERIDAEREAERQRLEAQRLEQEATARKLSEQQFAIDLQREIMEAEARAAENARLQAEREFAQRQQAEELARQRAEQEAKRAKEAEAERVEAERIKAEQAAAAAPDKEKMQSLAIRIHALLATTPKMAGSDGQATVARVQQKIGEALDMARAFVKSEGQS